MKWGNRWGDPWGRVEDVDSSRFSNVRLEPLPDLGPRAYRLSWSWSGGFKWGQKWGNPWGAYREHFKVYVNNQLVNTQRATVYHFTAPDDGQVTAAVIAVGALNSDPDYDPGATLVPGNRAEITWARPIDDDNLEEFRIYWDAGGGTIDFDDGDHLAVVKALDATTFLWTSGVLADGTYKFAVRSRDTAGNEETNVTEISVVILTWPDSPTGLAFVYDEGTDKVTLTWDGGATVDVYSNGGSGDIDYTAAEAVGQTSPWVSAALTGSAPGTFKYGVRAQSGALEETNTAFVQFELDASADEVTRPASPFGIRVVPAASAEFTVTGFFDQRLPLANGGQPTAATEIRIYHDNGTGTVDFNTEIDQVALSVSASGRRQWTFTTSVGAYADRDVVIFAARAATAAGAGGVLDTNTEEVSATADDDAPGAPTGLAGSAVRAVVEG